MPISAASHIQKMAPGLPRIKAMATPIKLPQPIRAAGEVHKAWNGEMPPPRVPESLRIVKVWHKWRIWMKPVRSVNQMPVPNNR